MRLLLLARTSAAYSEWDAHLGPLSANGWEVTFAPTRWERGAKSAAATARLRHDAAWSLAPPRLSKPGLHSLASRALRKGGAAGGLIYRALSANAATDSFIEDVRPDCVAVLADGKGLKSFAPLLAAARAQRLPRILLHGWGPLPTDFVPSLFDHLAVPDASLIGATNITLHGFGPIQNVVFGEQKLTTDTFDAGEVGTGSLPAERQRVLTAAKLDPDAPYSLYLGRAESEEMDGGMVPDSETADAIAALLHAAPELQVAILPDADTAGATEAIEAANRRTKNGQQIGLVCGSKEGSKARALRRMQMDRAYQTLAGGAAFVIGQANPRLLDAAASGLPVLALPSARGFIDRAGQTERFAPLIIDKLDGLRTRFEVRNAAPLPAASLADILYSCVKATRSGPGRQTYEWAGKLELGQALPPTELPMVQPAVIRRVARNSCFNIGLDDLDDILGPIAASSNRVLVGPWISEVGYELLYWIPFVRWCIEHYGIDPARLTICSRGGVACWYGDLAQSSYLDIFDMMDEATFREATLARFADAGGQKHVDLGPLDDHVADEVRGRTGDGRLDWIHPQVMYRFLRSYWLGRQSRKYFDDHTILRSFSTDPQPELDGTLPDDYIAVRFYFRPSFPDTPENRRFATQLVTRLAEQCPVVLIETGLHLDDHIEFAPSVVGQIHRIGHLITGRNNLALQTDVIRRSRMFIGTYGGLSYLPPFCGVPAVAISENTEGFLSTHLETAIRIFARMGVAFSHLDTAQARQLVGPTSPELANTALQR